MATFDIPHDESLQRYDVLTKASRTEIADLPEEQRLMAGKVIETINSPLYRAIAYQLTSSLEIAQQIHNQVRDEAMYILFLDRKYESGDNRFQILADECHSRVMRTLKSEQQRKLLDMEEKLFKFWSLEQRMKHAMETDMLISDADLREFIRRKSTDVFAYGTVARQIAHFPREVMLELYGHQLLRDLEDDHADLEEDAVDTMPNPLLLRLKQRGISFTDLPQKQTDLEAAITITGVSDEHRSFVQSYCHTILKPLPKKFAWIRDCARINVEKELP